MNKDELIHILEQMLDIDGSMLKEDTQLGDIGFDSIQFVSFIVAIEEKYGIEILDSDLVYENFATFGMMYATLSKYFASEMIYKCIITDCDGVLWRGVAGESGADEAYYDASTLKFCDLLRDLRTRGVMIVVCSKNEEKNIMTMLNSESAVLSPNDFVLFETNVENKADSVMGIISALGIYQDSAIFIDDSDYELGLIASVLPQVKIVKADDGFIDEIIALFANVSNKLDIDRTILFKEQKKREKVHVHTNSAEEYNNTLETLVICRKAEEAEIPRMAELSQRANRFNMNGKRYTEIELLSMLYDKEYSLYILKASDKYGDLGLVAMSVVKNGCEIESFILSCRVFGRDFESILLNEIRKESNTTHLYGKYITTDKNDYCKEFFCVNGIIE